MKLQRSSLAASIIVLCALCAFAETKQLEGERIVSDAVRLSDIRASHAPAFRIRATFNTLREAPQASGRYTETWLSREQWRREINIGKFQLVELARLERKWVLDSGEMAPDAAIAVINAIDLTTLPKPSKVKKIVDKNLDGAKARCVWSETEVQTDLYCVDVGNHTLLSYESLWHGSQKVHTVYRYKSYGSFGDHVFPRFVEVDREGAASVDVRSEVLPDVSADESLFAPLVGGFEVTNCPASDITSPVREFAPEPHFPIGHDEHPFVVLSLIVDDAGKPHLVRVTRSAGPDYDAEAVKTVERWKFKPAQCRGKNVGLAISLGVSFNGSNRLGGID
jgi:TonB family protein